MEFRCLGPCSVISSAPKSLYCSPIGICQQLSALCLLPSTESFLFTALVAGAGVAMNLGNLEEQPLAQSDDPDPYSGLSDTGNSGKSVQLLVLGAPEVPPPFLLQGLRSSQVCSNRRLNSGSPEADNEARTCYLREAQFIRCAHQNNTHSSDSCIHQDIHRPDSSTCPGIYLCLLFPRSQPDVHSVSFRNESHL